MDQDTERAAVDDEPGDEGAELCRREDVHLKHGDWVRADGLLPELVDAQLGDYRGTSAVGVSAGGRGTPGADFIAYIPS